MTVSEFVKGYNKVVQMNGDIEDYITDRYTDPYVPFRKKVSICENIAKISSHKKVDGIEGVTNDKEVYALNRPARYMMFMLSLIDSYTDIDISFGDGELMLDEYEVLDELDVIQPLIAGDEHGIMGIPPVEYERFKMIMDMTIADIDDNENNFINYLDSKFEAISTVFDVLLDGLSNAVGESVSQEISNMSDEEKKEAFTVLANSVMKKVGSEEPEEINSEEF